LLLPLIIFFLFFFLFFFLLFFLRFFRLLSFFFIFSSIRLTRVYSQVADAYGIYAWNKKTYLGRDEGATSFAPRLRKVDAAHEQQKNVTLNSRATVASSDPYWELSLMSVPPNGKWGDFFQPQQSPTRFTYEADDTYGRGQTIYLVEDGIPATHPVRPTPACCPVCQPVNKICRNLLQPILLQAEEGSRERKFAI
jgi:hypothetical protein